MNKPHTYPYTHLPRKDRNNIEKHEKPPHLPRRVRAKHEQILHLLRKFIVKDEQTWHLPRKVIPKALTWHATDERVHRLWKELKARMEFPELAMISSVRDRFMSNQLKGVRSWNKIFFNKSRIREMSIGLVIVRDPMNLT
jgi:hypothetical protein